MNRVGKDQYGCYLISSTGETFQPRVRGLNTQKEGEKGQLLCQLGCPFPPSPPVSNNLGKGVLHAAFTHMDTDTHTHLHTRSHSHTLPDKPFAQASSPSTCSPPGPPAVLEQPITGHLHALSGGLSPSGPPVRKCFLKEGKIKEQGFTPRSPR